MISPAASVHDALSAIMRSGSQMATIVNERGQLKAIICDSDIRRALLTGAKLSDRALIWAKKNPVVGKETDSGSELALIATEERVRDLPLIDDTGRLVDIYLSVIADSKVHEPAIDNTCSKRRTHFGRNSAVLR